MRIADTDILIQPGLDNSGEGHWQRRWAERFPNAHVIEQHEWHKPVMHDWVEHIAHDVMMATRPVVIVAHSLGVIAVADAAAQFKDHKVRGAFLVSPPLAFACADIDKSRLVLHGLREALPREQELVAQSRFHPVVRRCDGIGDVGVHVVNDGCFECP